MFIKALLSGIFIGCSVSLCIITNKLSESNEYGNYSGGFRSYAELDTIIEEESIIPFSLFRRQARKKQP